MIDQYVIDSFIRIIIHQCRKLGANMHASAQFEHNEKDTSIHSLHVNNMKVIINDGDTRFQVP